MTRIFCYTLLDTTLVNLVHNNENRNYFDACRKVCMCIGMCVTLTLTLILKAPTFENWDQSSCAIKMIRLRFFGSKAEKCGPGGSHGGCIIVPQVQVTTGNDTLRVADGLSSSLMEEDWPDNTHEADRCISWGSSGTSNPPAPPQNLHQAGAAAAMGRRSRSCLISQRRANRVA